MRRAVLIAIRIFALTLLATAITAQTTAFSFQGKLNAAGAPASGVYEMQFQLFDAVKDGNPIGKAVTDLNVSVVDGVFTTTLDFGAASFDGSPRFLEIGVRTAKAPDPFTILSPRQSINAIPYAVRAANAATSDTAINAEQLSGLDVTRFVQYDAKDNVAIGTKGSGSKLTVGGAIESTKGGIKFPDQTTQTSAGLTGVATNKTLTGDGTSSAPLGVASQSQNEPALQAVQVSGLTFGDPQPLLTVPDGKRLVIEFISGSLAITSGQRFLSTYLRATVSPNGALKNHFFVPVLAGTQTGVDYYTISQSVRIYANPGTVVYLALSSTNGNGTFNGTVSGYYVDVP